MSAWGFLGAIAFAVVIGFCLGVSFTCFLASLFEEPQQ